MWYNKIIKTLIFNKKGVNLMDIIKLEVQLWDEDFVIDSCAFRNKGEISFPSPEETKDFLIKFWVLETTAGVNYEDEEMLDAYEKIVHLVNHQTTFSSKDLPYHRKKTKPVKEIIYTLDGCQCFRR